MEIFKDAVKFEHLGDLDAGKGRKNLDAGYITFKTPQAKIRALLACDEQLNQMTIGKSSRLHHNQRFTSLQLLPHDTHEILNISGVEFSGLTAEYFMKKAQMKNLAEV